MRNLYIIKMGSFLLPYASSSIESIICIRIFSNSYSAILFVNNIDICHFHLSKKKSSSDEDDLPMGDVLTVRLNSHSLTTSRQYSHEPATNASHIHAKSQQNLDFTQQLNYTMLMFFMYRFITSSYIFHCRIYL